MKRIITFVICLMLFNLNTQAQCTNPAGELQMIITSIDLLGCTDGDPAFQTEAEPTISINGTVISYSPPGSADGGTFGADINDGNYPANPTGLCSGSSIINLGPGGTAPISITVEAWEEDGCNGDCAYGTGFICNDDAEYTAPTTYMVDPTMPTGSIVAGCMTFNYSLSCAPLFSGCGCSNCPQPLPDGANEDFFVNVSDSGTDGSTTDDCADPLEAINLNFDHEYLGDLQIMVTSPCGGTATLVAPIGFTGGTGIYDLTFIDGAGQWVNNGQGNTTGTFSPNTGTIAGLNCADNCGTWTLNVLDDQSVDIGNFIDFQLAFGDADGDNATELACNSNPPANCPIVTTPIAGAEDICDGGTPVLDASALMLDDATLAVGSGTVSWWLDAAFTMAYAAPLTYPAAGDGCTAAVVPVFASVECLEDNSVIAAGTVDVNVWPALNTAGLAGDGTCGPSFTAACAGYTITNDYDANGAAPDFSAETGAGTVTFTITNTGAPAGCDVATVVATYDCAVAPACPATASINEFHYDNAGTDVGEFVEVIVPAGTDVSGITIYLINGSTGVDYDSQPMSALTPTTIGTDDYYVWSGMTSIQNGAPDGILLECGGTVLDFVSYEGGMSDPTVNGTVYTGISSTDVGVAEPGGTNNSSIQLIGGVWTLCDDSNTNGGVNACGVAAVCTLVLSPETVTCDATTAGTDTYTVSIPFDNGTEGAPGAGNYTITTTGTVGGDNPMIAATGTITLTFNEGDAYSYQITGIAGNANESCDIIISGASPVCEPAACTLVLSAETVTCDAETAGIDTYTVSIPFDNGTEGAPGAGNYTITTTGTVGGDNPMTAATGTITLTFNEGDPYSYQITGIAGNANESCDVTVSGSSPSCGSGCNASIGTWNN